MTAGKVDCSAVVGGLRASFNSGRTRGAAARRVALTHLLEMLDTEEDAIVKALAEDLNKPPFEAVLMEMDVVRSYAVKKELKQALFLCNICVVFRPVMPFGYLSFYPRLDKCQRRSQIFPVAFRRFCHFRSFGII